MSRFAAIVAVAMVVAVSTACGFGSESTVRQREFEQLMQYPDLDQATERYEQLYTEIRTQVTAQFPQLSWSVGSSASASSCGREFPAISHARTETEEAQRKGLAIWVGSVGLAGADWERAVDTVSAIAVRYGFQSPDRKLDRAVDHGVTFRDQYGAVLDFGSAVKTTLMLTTGCHLIPEAKRRGVPAPENNP